MWGNKQRSEALWCRGPRRTRGILLLVIAMTEILDFFQKQAQECRRLAAKATKKNDRDYWLRLAQRWEWLAQQQKSGVAEIETAQPLRSGRSVLEKRFAKRTAA